jgi:hypothetical protein
LTSLLRRSTEPWLCGCLGFPCTSSKSGHIVFNSVMTAAVNSLPLSLCRMCGAPMKRKMSIKLYATSAARLVCSDLRMQNFVKWSYQKCNEFTLIFHYAMLDNIHFIVQIQVQKYIYSVCKIKYNIQFLKCI